MKCIVDEYIKEIGVSPSEFSRMTGGLISRALLWKHKNDPYLIWRAENAITIEEVSGGKIQAIDLMTLSLLKEL